MWPPPSGHAPPGSLMTAHGERIADRWSGHRVCVVVWGALPLHVQVMAVKMFGQDEAGWWERGERPPRFVLVR